VIRNVIGRFLVATIWFAAMGVAGSAKAGGYVVSDMGTLGSIGAQSEAFAVNNFGQAAGYSYFSGTSGPVHAFVYIDGAMHDIGVLPGDIQSIAYGLNNKGQAVGISVSAEGKIRGFLYSNGLMQDLSTFVQGMYAIPRAINDKGEVTGYTDTSSFVYRNGAVTNVPGVCPTCRPLALGINNRGDVVGYGPNQNGNYVAFIYSKGATTEVSISPDFSGGFSSAVHINDRSDIVGFVGSGKGYIYSQGTAKLLSGLPDAVLGGTGVTSLNNNGVATGYNDFFSLPEGATRRAVIYVNGQALDLLSLIRNNEGWNLLYVANAISDVGHIVGIGRINGSYHAFLLTPQ
jgi:probable HAF family extracellular repeat protein